MDSEWINLFEIAGMTFLDKSLTADVKHVSRSMISGRPLGEAQIMPIEVQSASPVEKVEEAVSKMIGSKTIIWIAVGSSVTLSLALAAAMILYKKAKQQPAEGNDLKKAQVI